MNTKVYLDYREELEKSNWEVDPRYLIKQPRPKFLLGEFSPCCGAGICEETIDKTEYIYDKNDQSNYSRSYEMIQRCSHCETILRKKRQ